jgi:prepilin-type N-terminal cleavage/methylation domain-containing protein
MRMYPPLLSPSCRPGRRGFTLAELLVAMTVLVVMLAFLTEMVQLVASAWQFGTARASDFSETRTVLGMIERDVQGMVVRPDVAAFCDSAGNPALAFYTRFPGGATTNRKVSLVEYALTTTGNPQLLRYDDGGLAYAASTPPEIQLMPTTTGTSSGTLTDLPTSPLTTSSQNITAVPSKGDQAELLVNGVVAFKYQFMNGSGTYQSNFQFNYSQPTAAANTPTLVVSIAVLDNAAYQMAANAGAFSKLAGDLAPGAPTGTQTYAQYWNGLMATAGFGSNLPLPVRAGIQVFERRIAIPVPMAIIN